MITPDTVTTLVRKFGDIADGHNGGDIMAAASLLLTELIVEQDIPLNKKMRLIDDITASMKKYIRSVQ